MEALGLSLAAGALVAAGAAVERRRTRRLLNESLHELRRPLQALALVADGEGGDGWMEQARAALDALDRTVNGRSPQSSESRVNAAELLCQARRRWARIGAVQLTPGEGPLPIEADATAVSSALDNLIANALEHGRGPVRLRARAGGGSVRLEVENRGPLRPGLSPDPRRGHGLGLAARIAAEQRGRLRPPVERAGAVSAVLELPLAGDR